MRLKAVSRDSLLFIGCPAGFPAGHRLKVGRPGATTVFIALVTLSGCGSIEPWVKPYERAAFADPIMAANPNPVSGSYINHVREAREGARGATGVAGGGCGCN